MLRPKAVERITRKAQKMPGHYGIFCNDAEFEDLYGHLLCYGLCYGMCIDDTSFLPYGEAKFTNGSRVKIYSALSHHYYGLKFNDVLYSDKAVRDHVQNRIKLKSSGKPEDRAPEVPPSTPVFGL